MENKYYVPEISEFHVGFEYEVEDFNKGHDNPQEPTGQHWLKKTIKSVGRWVGLHQGEYDTLSEIEALDDIYMRNIYRVKYLDREDIESLGWRMGKQGVPTEDYLGWTQFKYMGYELILDDERGVVINRMGSLTYSERAFFRGTIKNKSELKKVLQMIGV